ncbi:MAG TPA: hypothetical protein VGC41_24790, partial [Kofleriaceae bacterium]
ITRALRKESRGNTIELFRTRPDDFEAILEAVVEPSRIVNVRTHDTQLTRLPRNLERFPKLLTLWLEAEPFDGTGLHTLAFPELRQLFLGGCRIVSLDREQLAGFPALRELRAHGSALDDLDPRIIEVCPQLQVVSIEDTPLAHDEPRMAALKAQCPRLRWSFG